MSQNTRKFKIQNTLSDRHQQPLQINSVKSVESRLVPCYPAPLIPSAGSRTAQQGTSCADIAAAAIHRGNILYHHIRSACPPHPFCLPKKESITQGLSANDTACNISNHPKVNNSSTCAWESYFLNLTAELIIPFDQLVQVGNTIGKYSECLCEIQQLKHYWFQQMKKLVIACKDEQEKSET